jgi:hypothetical protein
MSERLRFADFRFVVPSAASGDVHRSSAARLRLGYAGIADTYAMMAEYDPDEMTAAASTSRWHICAARGSLAPSRRRCPEPRW